MSQDTASQSTTLLATSKKRQRKQACRGVLPKASTRSGALHVNLNTYQPSDAFLVSCSPVGSFIPKDQVQNPQDLMLWLKINGETKQKGSTNLMLYRIPALIEHCSSIMRLEEGDLLLTGTRFVSSRQGGTSF